MGESTAISWTEATYNPWQGCTKVSPGCAHCYMFRDKKKYGQNPEVVVRSQPATFNKPLAWERKQMQSGERLLVFTCSWSDFFHETADPWRDDAWDIIRRTPHLTYQILTKRPERILEHLPVDWGEDGWPNVWLGTSVENQRWTTRIHELLRVPAVVHFLSCEPLLSDLKLIRYLEPSYPCSNCDAAYYPPWRPDQCRYCEGKVLAAGKPTKVDWVIVGGESGPGFRAMNPNWARHIQAVCERFGIPFWYKQDSGMRPGMNAMLDGVEYHQFPDVG